MGGRVGQRLTWEWFSARKTLRVGGGRCASVGFSLIEVVIVIVILAIIAAIAIPRLSRGSDGAAEATTSQNTSVLQKAVDLYAAEHGAFPDANRIADQLTLFSDAQGSVSKTHGPSYPFGPYVRKVPPVTTGPNKGSSVISKSGGTEVGWVYDPGNGSISANTASASTTQPTTAPAESPDNSNH